jgi:hypothetical protein
MAAFTDGLFESQIFTMIEEPAHGFDLRSCATNTSQQCCLCAESIPRIKLIMNEKLERNRGVSWTRYRKE